MQPPIPDPFAPPTRPNPLVRGGRPPLLVWLIGVEWFISSISMLESQISYPDSRYPLITISSNLLFLYIDYSLYWGRNWARLTKIVVAFIVVLGTFHPQPQLTIALIILIGVRAVFAIVSIAYLTRPAVVCYFKGKPNAPSA